LAKPGLSGFNSNSSSHTTQTRIGNGIESPQLNLHNTTLQPESKRLQPSIRTVDFLRTPS
jgi:hypothetical protein